MNCCVRLIRTEALAGETLTVTGGAVDVMVTAAVPTADGIAWLVACTVTVAGVGTVDGAA